MAQLAQVTALRSQCGAWPSGIELWLNQGPEEAVDSMDNNGRLLRSQSNDGYTLEVLWPRSPRVDYDLGYEPPGEMAFWATETEGVIRLGIDPAGATDAPPHPPPNQRTCLGSSSPRYGRTTRRS